MNKKKKILSQELEKIWNKTVENIFFEPKLPNDPFGFDSYKRIIKWSKYGKKGKFGWNIHHVDGNLSNNDIINLRALHWKSCSYVHKKIIDLENKTIEIRKK